MTNPTRRELALLPLALGVIAAGRAEAQMSIPVENASLTEVQEALAKGATTATRPHPRLPRPHRGLRQGWLRH